MFRKILNLKDAFRDRQRIGIALSKGAAACYLRQVINTEPETWEFSGFSQNGEDGILQVLRSQLKVNNRYFIEIGAADGIDNNSAWMAIVEKYNGLMIEGSPELVFRARRMVGHYSLGLQIEEMFVDIDSAENIKTLSDYLDPDVMSLDIDGIDYFVAEKLFAAGFRPKIFAVEYNSVHGPEKARCVKYSRNFNYTKAHPSELYYGVSIGAWRHLFESQGYRFVTVDRNGVNAFFVDPEHFDSGFLDGVRGSKFRENQLQWKKFRTGHEGQFELIKDMEFYEPA
ncbi:MAG: hypothetical protein RH862_14850 [Leptospiraceae bacterium]